MVHDSSSAFAQRWLPRLHKFQNGLCCYCEEPTVLKKTGRNRATFEHKKPRARGGMTDLENAAMSCSRCNNYKGTATHEEFLREIRQAGGIKGLIAKRMKERTVRKQVKDQRRALARGMFVATKEQESINA